MPENLVELLKYCSVDENSCIGCERWEYDCGSSKCVNNLMIQAAEALEKQQWISVMERLPEEDTRVLVWLVDGANKYTRMDTDRRHNSKWVRWEKYVTHWMPLPDAPKGE